MPPNGSMDTSTKKAMTRNLRNSREHKLLVDKEKESEKNGIISGKNIFITGGAAGLGYAFCNHFLQFGANKICIIDVDEVAGGRIVVSTEKSHGAGKVIFIRADVSRYSEIVAAFEEAMSRMGGVDIVVNNAGIIDERRWEREIAVNMGGMISVAMLTIEYMGKHRDGRGGILINIAEHMDIKFTAQLPVYNATKQAIIGLSQSLAASCNTKRTGVRVITLCPGLTETALTIDSPNKLLSRVMKADFVKNLEQLTIQTPYVVAQGLMSILRTCESGSVWVIENGHSPFEVYLPNFRSLRRLYKNNFTITDDMKCGNKNQPITDAVCDSNLTDLTSCV
ncbi:PREDICTED: 15-hydroxyprostaglandin dehydrogenase [NAD(+)]-like [Ceratosolen solmsi marchali]|uniref:15-hydroxyprostaglandin dehydrogenase [NAD(+)] n=1 Tax=Ceratosolen solmsi marchali TaxID=326594 RepID=A0AAJ6YF37_9HYME|nr:PREDICTED: 15-hydroxyprostaglandin dehydrogenase [NAD(+)]-like [Ceratosolen solmsi marchali]